MKRSTSNLKTNIFKSDFIRSDLISINLENILLFWVPYLISFLIILPIFQIFFSSFKVEEWGKEAVFTFSNYVYAFSDPRIFDSILNTFWVSAGATAIAAIVGISLAWLVARTDMPFKGLFELFNTFPMFLSPLVGVIAWKYLAAPRAGFLNHLAQKLFGTDIFNIYGLPGMIWVLGIFFTPTVYLLTVGSLKRMDPALEESSRGCGAGIAKTVFKITLPLASPGILAAITLVFVMSAGGFAVPLALGSPFNIETLVTMVFEFLQKARPDYNLAAAAGSILMVLTISLTYFSRKIISKKSYITVTGKGYRPNIIKLGKWKYVGLSWNILYITVAIFLPVFILLIISLHSFWLGFINFNHLTLKHYYELIFVDKYAIGGFKNSLFLGAFGATIGMISGTITAYFIQRTRFHGRAIVEYIASLPIGIPGLVLAMGFLLIFIRTPLYGTIWVLMICYIIRYTPYALRSVSAVLLALSPELDESSRSCGASLRKTIKNILRK